MNNEKENLLITGSTGYLGNALFKKIVDSNRFNIFILVRKSSDLTGLMDISSDFKIVYNEIYDVKKLFNENCFSKVIHCATGYGKKYDYLNSVYDVNFSLPLLLLDLAIKTGVKLFINTSTSLNKYLSNYSLSKKHFEEVAFFMTKNMEISFLNIELEQFYGSNMGNALFCSYIINSLKENVPEINLTSGEQKRDFIFIDDVVRAYMMLINNDFNTGYTNIPLGSGKAITVRDFAEKAKNIIMSSSKLNFGAVQYRTNEPMHTVADLTMLNSLDWKPEVSIEEGIEKCLI
jgi:CDP-paratose synthetase